MGAGLGLSNRLDVRDGGGEKISRRHLPTFTTLGAH